MLRALVLSLVLASAASAQSGAIRLNQVGFYPNGPKRAAVVTADAGAFTVRPAAGGAAVLTGMLGASARWAAAGETVRQADFSALTTPGTYVVEVAGVGTSYPFEVRAGVHEEVARAALKGYYFQRASTALDAAHAGQWARAAGHPDTRVVVHASAATASRPAGTVISSPRGWYDAGDYNKYIVNSGISVGTLLAAYEWNRGYLDAFRTNIPESGNGLPDILDEALWNVRWMMTMQDEDGGVYHKLTTANFSGEVAPRNATATRYVVQKGTAATLDFASVMAQAARITADFPTALPGLSDSLRTAALRAWTWADNNRSVRYSQAALNTAYNPDINTGEYGDGDFGDEFDWAAMELYLTTRADSFLTITRPLSPVRLGTPYWGSVREMGYYSLLAHRDDVGANVDIAAVRTALLATANRFADQVARSPYGITMGDGDFYWGSNAVAANQGMALVMAYRLTGEARYLDAATAALDYILGRNATGYSFLTGMGSKTPQDIHHRPSRSDGIAAPVPGLLAGGPNSGRQDGCTFPSTLAAKSYLDSWCSYSSNEIAINWNAPLVFLAVSIEAARSQSGMPTADETEAMPETDLGLGVSPNPFREQASVRVSLAAPAAVTVRVIDVLGREVRRPLDGAVLGAGEHPIAFDGRGLAPGVYVVRLETPGGAVTRTITRVR